MGQLAAGCKDLQKSLNLSHQLAPSGIDARYSQDPRVLCLGFLLISLQLSGYPEQARQKAELLKALVNDLQHPHSLAQALHNLGVFYLLRRELESVQQYVEALIALAMEHRFPHFLAFGEILQDGVCLLPTTIHRRLYFSP